MTFPELNAKHRTDESFRQATAEKHHIQQSPLTDIGIGMVTCFPHDYMHLVCLGVMRRLLDLWISTTGPLHCRISSIQASMVSDRLIALRNYIPCEFARRPRALADRYVTSAKTSFYKEKLEASSRDPRKFHNIISSLLNPPTPPPSSSLTAEDFASFYQ
ncbi:uncharacterized protein LOC113076649 isoform X1 [Tachysurus ichikawai]